jgi:hypothetical protein
MLVRSLIGRSHKLVELAAGGIERILLLFRDPGPNEGTAIVVQELQKKRFGRLLRSLGLFLGAADDFATEHSIGDRGGAQAS